MPVLPLAQTKLSRHSFLNLNCNFAIPPIFLELAASLLAYLLCQLRKSNSVILARIRPCLRGVALSTRPVISKVAKVAQLAPSKPPLQMLSQKCLVKPRLGSFRACLLDFRNALPHPTMGHKVHPGTPHHAVPWTSSHATLHLLPREGYC